MKAIILLSGGIDSSVMLAIAKNEGKECLAISFDYGQRHRIELKSAISIAQYYGVPQRIISIDPSCFTGPSFHSALTSKAIVPKDRTANEIESSGIPSTYVPARNTLFIAYALGQAEMNKAQEIHIGCNALDYKPYPDCRPEYIKAYQALINLATKQSIDDCPPQLITPLLHLDKKEIIKKGMDLKVPFDFTWTCYSPNGEEPCERCDACLLRNLGFAANKQG